MIPNAWLHTERQRMIEAKMTRGSFWCRDMVGDRRRLKKSAIEDQSLSMAGALQDCLVL